MADKRWEFELDGVRHTVELEHNPFSKVQSLRVDGRLQSTPAESPQRKDRGRTHAFRIEGHACKVIVSQRGRRFDYDLLIDGVSNTSEQHALETSAAQPSEKVKGTARAAGGLFILIGVGGNWFNWYWAHSKGYYWGELSLIAPAIGFIGLYFLFFPKEFAAQYTGKLSVRTWIAIILALALGFANMYAFDHGLY